MLTQEESNNDTTNAELTGLNAMKKVLVIGSPGSGKSTFSRKLHALCGLPLFHLDQLHWTENATEVEPEIFRSRLQEVLARDAWIIDGNYGATMEQRLALCDTVFFLDYPVELCIRSARERIGKKREDIPWIEKEEDPEFIEYIRCFPQTKRPLIFRRLEKYPLIMLYHFRSREEAQRYLDQFTRSAR